MRFLYMDVFIYLNKSGSKDGKKAAFQRPFIIITKILFFKDEEERLNIQLQFRKPDFPSFV